MQVYVQNKVYNMVITGNIAGLVKYRQVQGRMWYTLHVDRGHWTWHTETRIGCFALTNTHIQQELLKWLTVPKQQQSSCTTGSSNSGLGP